MFYRMDECFICGISSDRARLFDAITGEGIGKICENCSINENIPVIRKPTTFQLKEAERKTPVPGKTVIRGMKDKQEITLRDIVDRNYKEKVNQEKKPRPDLIENFHWAIMRARRARKLMQNQLAEAIGESVAAVRMAEQGVLPEDDYKLLNKLERYLDVALIKREVRRELDSKPKSLDFDKITSKELTIADLREMKRQKGEINEDLLLPREEVEDFENEEKINEFSQEQKKNRENDDISQDEINRIIFGKK